MSTTNLVVEIVIIGVQVSIWLGCFLLTFSLEWVRTIDLSAAKDWLNLILVVLFSIAYPLGIAVDRGADSLFRWLNKTSNLSRRGMYGRLSDHVKVRRDLQRMIVYMNENRSTDLIDYPRSRLRIARATTFNAVLISLSLCFLLSLRGGLDLPSTLIADIGILALGVSVAALSFYAAVEVQVTEDVRTELIIWLIPHIQPDAWTNLDLDELSRAIASHFAAQSDANPQQQAG